MKTCAFQVFQYSKEYKGRGFFNLVFFFSFPFFALNKGLFKLVKGEAGFRNPKQQIAGPGSQEVFPYCVSLNQVSPHTSYCMLLFLFPLVLFVKWHVPCSEHFFQCVQVRCLPDLPHFLKHSNNFIPHILHLLLCRIIDKYK